jgi:stress response protein YsnF
VDPDVQLTAGEEQLLYRHYQLAEQRDDEGAQPPAASSSDDAMTRSEEEVRISTRRRERGRARLKKYVVTDYVEKKIPVQREEVRLEYEPADEGESPS